MTITMSDNVAIAIVILAIVILIIGGPFAVNEYNKWRAEQALEQYLSSNPIIPMTWTSPPTPIPTPIPTTPAPAVKDGIYGGWWCAQKSSVECYQFFADKTVYKTTNWMPDSPQRMSWWVNSNGYYETSSGPTFIYHGNTMTDTFGNVYHWCPYQATKVRTECLD